MEDAYVSPKKEGDPSYLFSEKVTVSAKISKGSTLWKYIIRQFLKSQKIKSVENIHRDDPYLFSEIFAISAKISQDPPLCIFNENENTLLTLSSFFWNHFEMFTVAIENICEVLHMRKTRGRKLTADVPKISV